ncbi:hypothetical protein DBR47_10945 [Paucibacter sp. KBW04]|nr:hypothetical protein DBR47_10945 [Paucibacter sp. KBW04]
MARMKKKEVDFLQQMLGQMDSPFYLSYRFIALSELVTRENDALYKNEVGLGIKELRVLRLVHLNPGQPVFMIGRWSFAEKAMTSKLVGKLCELGLLERRIDGKDARSLLLYVTPAGAEKVKAADAAAHRLFAQHFPSMSPERAAQLMGTLDELILEFVSSATQA